MEDSLRNEFKKALEHYQSYEDAYFGNYPFGICFHGLSKLLNKWINIRDPKQLFNTIGSDKGDAKMLLDTSKGIADFASKNKADYDAIKKFYESNLENFRELEPQDQDKADKMKAFLQLDNPRSEYRHIRKAYDELKKALDVLKQNLTEEVNTLYVTTFDELDQEAKDKGVTDANVYADRNALLSKVKRIESIAQLKNEKLGISNFKSDQIRTIIDYARSSNATPTASGKPVGEPEEYYVTNITATISNEEELEAYLNKLREDMKALLKKDKTIIIK